MEYKMVKTSDMITYFVNGKVYSFENQPEIISFIERYGLDFIVENKIESLILTNEKEVAFVKTYDGRKYLLPADITKFNVAEKNLLNNPNYYKELPIKDIFTIFSKNTLSSDGRIIVKCFCSQEIFESKGVVNLDVLESDAKDFGWFMIYVKVPINKTAGNRLNLSDEDIEIIESISLKREEAPKATDEDF